MGLLVSVYKDASSNYDCTNGGVSSRNIKGLCLTNVDGFSTHVMNILPQSW